MSVREEIRIFLNPQEVFLRSIKAQPLDTNKHSHQRLITYLKKLILRCIAVLLIIIGIAMIAVPSPSPVFEIATLYYFNPNDGITIMDLISLVIILFGMYIFIHTFSL
jgi:small-conductance mechanosensitive channel